MLIIKNNNELMNEWMINNILARKVYQLFYFQTMLFEWNVIKITKLKYNHYINIFIT